MEPYRDPLLLLYLGVFLMIIGKLWEKSIETKRGPESMRLNNIFPNLPNHGRTVIHVGFFLTLISLLCLWSNGHFSSGK